MLIPRFPGSKRLRWRLFADSQRFDCIIEPFAGGGSLTTKFMATTTGAAFVAEANRPTWSVWHCWADPGLHASVYGHLAALKAEALADFASAWPRLKEAYEGAEVDPARLAAVTLTIHRLTFGGIVRGNRAGGLNVKPVDCQLAKFPRWQYKFPPANGLISVGQQWEEAIASLEASSCSQALAIVDPPYWLPYTPGTKRRGTGGMSPSYPGHRPHAPETFAMAVDSARMLATSDKVRRLVVTNYLSAEMAAAMEEIATASGRYLQRVDLGVLASINKTRAAVTKAKDTAWILTREKPVIYYQEELNLWAS